MKNIFYLTTKYKEHKGNISFANLTNTLRTLWLTIITLFISSIVNAQSLEILFKQATENNPQLKSLHLNYVAEQFKADQITLKNPEIGLGVPILAPETRLGPQVVMISASQMFPWFGTLNAKRDVYISMSKAKYELISALKLELFNQIKVAYYQLLFLDEKTVIINDFLAIYKTLENVSLAKVESGESTITDVLRIQLKSQEFSQELNIINNLKLNYFDVINELTNQDFGTKITTEPIPNSELIDYNLEAYQKRIANNHPLINKLNSDIETSQFKQKVNSKSNQPTIGLGIDYSLVNQRTDANPLNNGQDIFIPKVKLSIPIYRKSYRSVNKQEEFYQDQLAQNKITIQNKLTRQIITNKTKYDNAILKIELYHQQIKTTKMAYDVLLANYSSSGKGFDDLLDIQNQLLKYKLGLKQEKLNKLNSIANINRLIG